MHFSVRSVVGAHFLLSLRGDYKNREKRTVNTVNYIVTATEGSKLPCCAVTFFIYATKRRKVSNIPQKKYKFKVSMNSAGAVPGTGMNDI